MKAAGYIRDLLGFIGLCLLGYGCWLLADWLAFMVVGLILLAMSVAGALRGQAPVPAPRVAEAGE